MSVSSFSIDFTDRDAALEHFEEGAGPLTTGGTLSCMREDHIRYGVLLDVRSAAGAEIGARLLLDGHGATACPGAHIAVGHLGSRAYYGFGDAEWRARIHHSPSGGAPPPSPVARRRLTPSPASRRTHGAAKRTMKRHGALTVPMFTVSICRGGWTSGCTAQSSAESNRVANKAGMA